MRCIVVTLTCIQKQTFDQALKSQIKTDATRPLS